MNRRFFDLSHAISDGLVTYPGLPVPRLSTYLSRSQSEGRYAAGTCFHIGRIDMVANTGTYIDAPFHRFEGRQDIAGLDLEQVADLAGLCIDVTENRRVDVADLRPFDVRGKAVLLRTGWSRHWGEPEYAINHPFVTREAAAWLVDNQAALVGIDSLNIDDTEDGERPVHTQLLEAGIPIVEHLCGLSGIVGCAFRFFAVPSPVEGLGSFPVRAFAMVSHN